MEPPKTQNYFIRTWQRFTLWASQHKVAAGSIAALVLTAAGFLGAVMYYTDSYTPAQIVNAFKNEPAEAEKAYYSPLTGEPVKNKAATTRQVTGIMIENSPSARPHSGMRQAGIVYEAIAEAGITRFLTIYQEAQPGLVGPVRSLRPYFVDWLAPYDAAYAHVGGSHRALQQVRSPGYKDIDQFFNAQGYYRSADRYAPHNMYTSFDRLNKVNKSKGYTKSKFDGWPRKPDAPVAKPNASRINVQISSPTYNSSYRYDPKTNSYVRSQGGGLHIDRESKKPLRPKVVIVMKVRETTVFEDGSRQKIKTNGKGTAYIFQDGTVQKATWQKRGAKKPLKFFAESREVQLNAGQTWVTALPIGQKVTWR